MEMTVFSRREILKRDIPKSFGRGIESCAKSIHIPSQVIRGQWRRKLRGKPWSTANKGRTNNSTDFRQRAAMASRYRAHSGEICLCNRCIWVTIGSPKNSRSYCPNWNKRRRPERYPFDTHGSGYCRGRSSRNGDRANDTRAASATPRLDAGCRNSMAVFSWRRTIIFNPSLRRF